MKLATNVNRIIGLVLMLLLQGSQTQVTTQNPSQGQQDSASKDRAPEAQIISVGPNVNVSARVGNQAEATVAINPANPSNLVVLSNAGGGLFRAFSLDGGATWTRGIIATGAPGGLPAACCDPSTSARAVCDRFGNIFLTYLAGARPNFSIIAAVSTDGGNNFNLLATLAGPGNVDQPSIAAGDGSVWVTYRAAAINIVAQGASVTGLGVVSAFTAAQVAPGSAGSNFGDIAIGPNGQVMVTYQRTTTCTDNNGDGDAGDPGECEGPATIFVNVDPDGLAPANGFGAQITATATNVGSFDFLLAQSGRSVDAEAGLAWDRTGGAHHGRVYLVYTDEAPDESNDTEIFVRFSDNQGTNWSAPVRVNDDATTNSQFLPRIALDPTTGNIAVSWHDCRNDTGAGAGSTNAIANDDAQFFAAVSTDGGLSFRPNSRISAGTSNAAAATAAGGGIDYGDYTGLDYFNDRFYPVWADNSNSTNDNPAGALSTFDLYTARVVCCGPPQVQLPGVVTVQDTCVGSSSVATLNVCNTGKADLRVREITSSNPEFSVTTPSAGYPVVISPDFCFPFQVRFTPTSAGLKTTTLTIPNNDPANFALMTVVTGTGTQPRIATVIANSGAFGDVCLGEFKDLNLTISNSGSCDLTVNNITVTPATDFLLPSVLSFPLVIQAGDSIEIPIRFHPASKGNRSATVRIFSNDPTTAVKTVTISGTALAPSIVVNDPIVFDKTCPGNTNNKTLTISNTGFCDLVVKSITSSNPLEFKVAPSVAFPLIVPPGGSRDVAIQFMPMGFTIDPMRMATLTIMSNDPDMGMKGVKVIGIVPPPVIQAAPDPLDFGKVCLNTSKTLPLVISNAGECDLTVSAITFSSTEFKLVSPPAFPFVIPPGRSRTVMVSFMPVDMTGARMETMTIKSDDPVTPMKVVTLKGDAPVSDIAISGSMNFGEVKVGSVRDQVLNITNTEPCDLLITLICEVQNGPVQFPSTEFNVISPAVTPKLIPGGGTLPVIIRFKPQGKGLRTATLLVFGYDPETSELKLKKSFPLKGVGK